MVIGQDAKILLVKGYIWGWEFPGGFVHTGESVKAAAIREVKEESGIDIQLTDFLGIEHNIEKSTMVIVLKGKPIGGKIATSIETKAVGYFTLEEALNLIQLDYYKERLHRCLNEKEVPFFIEKWSKLTC